MVKGKRDVRLFLIIRFSKFEVSFCKPSSILALLNINFATLFNVFVDLGTECPRGGVNSTRQL